jgi:hypothetical protein
MNNESELISECYLERTSHSVLEFSTLSSRLYIKSTTFVELVLLPSSGKGELYLMGPSEPTSLGHWAVMCPNLPGNRCRITFGNGVFVLTPTRYTI